MTTAERFRQAAITMRACGLNKGNLHGPNGSVCSLVALDIHHVDSENRSDVKGVLRYLGQATGRDISYTGEVCTWNNESDRTTENAARAFEAAAKLADKEEAVPA